MINVLFKDKDESVLAEVVRMKSGTIQILGIEEVDLSGFSVCLDNGDVFGDYSEYTTLYRKLDNGFELSSDGSVYIEPKPQEIEPYVPTIEELQNRKIREIETASDNVLRQGYTVTLTDGKEYHFPLSQDDEMQLMGLASEVANGTALIPWHTSDKTEPCRFFTNADTKIFTDKALALKTWSVTYLRDITRYIKSLDSEDSINAVTYGMVIPADFQSEPLKAMMAQMS